MLKHTWSSNTLCLECPDNEYICHVFGHRDQVMNKQASDGSPQLLLLLQPLQDICTLSVYDTVSTDEFEAQECMF